MSDGCPDCKYSDTDASDFPCSECWIEDEVLIRFIPKDEPYEWQIVKVKVEAAACQ